MKVFDFGLATEMKEDTRVKGTNLFKLTGETGSPRYMAPEVALSQPYNETSDVYAFSLLLSYVRNSRIRYLKIAPKFLFHRSFY